MWSGFYVGKHGGIVANNPQDPEAASMEVTDTRLVNLPEKTEFDVVSEFSFPALPPGGAASEALRAIGASVVFPDGVEDILNAQGLWDGSSIPIYSYSKNGVVYNAVSDIPGASVTQELRVTRGLIEYTENEVAARIRETNTGNSEVTVFQLDPNQLLTVTSGFKILLRRPLEN